MQARHDDIKDSVASWLSDLEFKCKKEQLIPKWNTEATQAILDIVYTDRRGKEIAIDISVVDGADGKAPAKYAITRRERLKHRRYPGSELVPFVIDCRGRWGKEALDYVTFICKDMVEEERYAQVRKTRTLVSHALQKAVAEQILSSSRPKKAGETSR